MDTRLLKHYEGELAFMRDMGAEFAEAFPKIAARLGMDGVEVVDPYVERLLEGVAFLSARVQLELELQYPTLTSHLLEIIYPHYLAPLPSMMVAAFEPDMQNAALDDGYTIPRHSVLRSTLGEDDHTACVFRSASDVTLWPITITEAEYIDGRGELAAAGISRDIEARAAIRLRLSRFGNLPIADLSLDNLVLFLNGQEGKNWDLHELLGTQVTGLVGRSTDRRNDWIAELPAGRVVPRGYDPEEALLPTPQRSFDGYRLLQEYFAMPERFHFVELQGLSMAIGRAKGHDVDIYILLREGAPDIASGVTPEAFTLHATPAINLFHKRCDRVHVSGAAVEQHVVADRTAPLDFEIFSIEGVSGISAEGEQDVPFRPFYSADDLTAAGERHTAYYTQSRKMRQRAERERLKGVRTSYLGSELYLSLVDSAQAPFSASLDQLAVQAMVTNRDLPLLLPTGSKDVFHLPEGGPVAHVTTPVSPTRPRPTLAQGDTAWRLISHLSLNYLSIAETGKDDGGAALRELIGIYAPSGNKVLEKQLEGLTGVSTRPIVRRMSDEVLSTAVRGLEISITFDESFFEGTSVYLLGAVLERFLRKYVSINSFTETVLVTQQRGEITRWRPRTGLGRIL
ncbi:type VI secretion system baseplate subunit TssF [Pseudosulfitobacter koreensis]|uniref:Type VI secretion system baseplate subunit TssF n=1 Tax=Pseudosulfitobacter koreensis TaxID=2968472 RepID=A0ABT1Z2L5_9RHOB|nr:type VI secretion system baseplate subunit TssF [Pseudosulfitobacter koreense]MCR8827353.1 type VI secretion system baseplate subunit TssF [Pseudosulfitobacter koreense]